MKTISFIVQTVMISSCLGVAAGSLQGQSCKDMVYGHENQIDPNPIELQRVAGKVLLPNGTVAPRICVGIFTESEHKLLRYGETDESGQFVIETTGLPDGDYRLVGLVPGFCPANTSIKYKARSHRKKTLVLHMNVRGIDTRSYILPSKN
jgi:hypothetical protein